MKYWLSEYPLNIAFHAGGDTKETIIKNRQEILESHGYKLGDLAFLNQVHGSKILKVDEAGFLGDGDGILMEKKGIVGMIMVADCNPILLFCPKREVLLLLHAGRVGIQKGIVLEGLRILEERCQSMNEVFAYVGASIRDCCYEVQEDVFEGEMLLDGKIIKEGKIYLDLIAILKKQFQQRGLCNYIIDPACTCCNRYFSYRRDRGCGRFGLFATL